MVGTKRVTIQEKTDVTESSTRQKTDTEDSSNVNELALEIVKRAIAAAIKFVEGSNPVWLFGGMSRSTMAHYQATDRLSPLFRRN